MIEKLLENNRLWSEEMHLEDPQFFQRLSQQQTPRYLWIGCSDSRVPANQIVGMAPGELFVHRNVANLVVHTDFNLLSVLQYAVDVLQVRHVIVCGHYGCGGIDAARQGLELGLIDNWLRKVQEIYKQHQTRFAELDDEQASKLLCELNVIAQASNVEQTTIVQQAWKRKQPLAIHGWVYSLSDGLIKDLGVSVKGDDRPIPIP